MFWHTTRRPRKLLRKQEPWLFVWLPIASNTGKRVQNYRTFPSKPHERVAQRSSAQGTGSSPESRLATEERDGLPQHAVSRRPARCCFRLPRSSRNRSPHAGENREAYRPSSKRSLESIGLPTSAWSRRRKPRRGSTRTVEPLSRLGRRSVGGTTANRKPATFGRKRIL